MKTRTFRIYFFGLLALTLLFLILATLADAAALPPMPSVPTVKRPAPLHSPKGSGAMSGTPMLRFAPASYAAAPVLCSLVKDVNFFGCNTNEPGCVFYDVTRVTAQQRSGVGLTLEFSDSVTGGWAWLAVFGASPVARIVETEWLQPVYQRPSCRLFRARETPQEAALARSATPTIRVSSPLVRAWVRKK